jgi:hypothetical protein
MFLSGQLLTGGQHGPGSIFWHVLDLAQQLGQGAVVNLCRTLLNDSYGQFSDSRRLKHSSQRQVNFERASNARHKPSGQQRMPA